MYVYDVVFSLWRGTFCPPGPPWPPTSDTLGLLIFHSSFEDINQQTTKQPFIAIHQLHLLLLCGPLMIRLVIGLFYFG